MHPSFIVRSICLLQLLVAVASICDSERSTFQACILNDAKADTECLSELTIYWACVTNKEDVQGIELCNRQFYDIFSICAQASGNCAQCGALVNETEPSDCGAANANWCQGSWATCCKPCQTWADDYASCLNDQVCAPFPPEPEKCASSSAATTTAAMNIVTILFCLVSVTVMHFV